MIFDEVLNSKSDSQSISGDSSISQYINDINDLQEKLSDLQEDLDAKTYELAQCKKQVEDLVNEINLKNDEVSEFSEISRKASLYQEWSKNKSLKIRDLHEKIDEKVILSQKSSDTKYDRCTT